MKDWLLDPQPPLIWSVAGTDSGGGAGLSADARAAAALGVHLCPVVAAVTAQHSQGVEAVHALPAEALRSQLAALAGDLRPAAIKTGLLASVAALRELCASVDALRRQGTVALVVDPVLGASAGGAAFADAALLQAYREELLPRCDLLTPNRAEARRLLGLPPEDASPVPALAAALRSLGARAVVITGGDDAGLASDLALDWLDAPLASGWLALPRLPSRHHHGSGCSFASAAAAALARGFVGPDAVVLAKMLSWCAVRDGYAAGAGAGPVRAAPGFVLDPAALPVMGFDDEIALPDAATQARWEQVLHAAAKAADSREPPAPLGLYAIGADAQRVAALAALAALGLPELQLRFKSADPARVTAEIRAALAAVDGRGCRLWINDHAALALEAGARALHLGQEDWAALPPALRARLLEPGGPALGLSSHSLWELARARGLAPHYIACGPVWPTLTKAMPWRPQGLANLAWWARMAGRPVVAIGGLLEPEQVRACAAAGAASACLVRALDRPDAAAELARFQAAWAEGLAAPRQPAGPPRPSLAAQAGSA
jgi:hydroxymethylpyrimidine kinase/phosphomethylpyrimidine kinase/thiamine-phosphate diphosphorylase